MDVTEYAKILLGRIEKFEPENSTKIIGYLLLNHTHEEIMGYAFGSEKQILCLINEAKSYLSSPKSVIPPHFPPQNFLNFPPKFLPHNPLFGISSNTLQAPVDFNQLIPQTLENYIPNLPKLCYFYYNKGYCKGGAKCRFVHDPNLNSNLNLNLGGLGRLEMEIREILITRGRVPVSIALLPIIYLEKYGKILQAEGYLTESQRHGKPGCSLTKLLARLKSICIIERPHGQHSIVLLEDLYKYIDNRFFQRDLIASSHQIYLTFPSESTFSESDVQNYFQQYGPVQEVRIPRQERRMFGFVSFVYPETARIILTRGHPHYIAGSRILVKPYKEKSKLTIDRRKGYFAPNLIDFGFNPFAMQADYNYNEYIQQMINERRLLEIQNISNNFTNGSSICSIQDSLEIPLDQFGKLKIDTAGASKSNSDHDCGEIELPDSPFA